MVCRGLRTRSRRYQGGPSRFSYGAFACLYNTLDTAQSYQSAATSSRRTTNCTYVTKTNLQTITKQRKRLLVLLLSFYSCPKKKGGASKHAASVDAMLAACFDVKPCRLIFFFPTRHLIITVTFLLFFL